MPTTIKWLGPALLGAAAVVVFLATAGAAVGDAVCLEQTNNVTLDAGEKSSLGSHVNSLCGVPAVQLDAYTLERYVDSNGANQVLYRCLDRRTVAHSAYLDLLEAETPTRYIPGTNSGGNVDVQVLVATGNLGDAAAARTTEIVALLGSIWPGQGLPEVRIARFFRSNGDVLNNLNRLITLSPADFAQRQEDAAAGTARPCRYTGRVQP